MDAVADADAARPCQVATTRCSVLGTAIETCEPNGEWSSKACVWGTPACVQAECTRQASCRIDNIMPCGLSGGTCCSNDVVFGNTFNRSNDARYPATVEDFRLDTFEINVSRFRLFVEAYPASQRLRLPADAGAHPSIPGSGWNADWNDQLPLNRADLTSKLKCAPTSLASWTDVKGANERLPINCVTWYEAFAFCIWDSGRVPTESEWNYATAGGLEQRLYPWPETVIDASRAVFGVARPADVGSKGSLSAGRWGHLDLAGNVSEWVLDAWRDPYRTGGCGDCTSLTPTTRRVARGGAFSDSASVQTSTWRTSHAPDERSADIGVRCARAP
jgi:formylglycine-generating enzyme required for sulfatase activity